MSQGGSGTPYSGQASLADAASHHGELLAGGKAEIDEPTQRPTELERMQAAAKQAERAEKRAATGGAAEVQSGGQAAQVKAGAEYLEKEVCVWVCWSGRDWNVSRLLSEWFAHTAQGHRALQGGR